MNMNKNTNNSWIHVDYEFIAGTERVEVVEQIKEFEFIKMGNDPTGFRTRHVKN
jgi:hypothetical protein